MTTALAVVPPRDCVADRADIEYRITELAAQIHAANYRLLCLIREFDEQEGWAKWGVRSCAHWLNWRCGTSLNAAREKVRVAHALPDLPRISDAFRKGELSYSKVRAMTRIATPKNEDYLMMIAEHGTASHVEKLVQKYRGVERTLDETNKSHRDRYLSYYYADDGALMIRARIPAEQGALVLKALNTVLDEINEEDYQNRVAAEQIRKDVSAETSEGAKDVGPVEDFPANSQWNTERFDNALGAPHTEVFPGIAAKRADALCRMAEQSLASPTSDSKTADRYQVLLHVSAETLRTGEAGRCELEPGPSVPAETARRIGCDCSVVGILEDDDGKTLNVGRKTRAIPPALRRALKNRDCGCRFPGCTQTKWVDGHHIHHWADGGETSLDNLVQLCRFHHRLVHEGGFGVRTSSSDEFVFTRPDGKRIPKCGTVAKRHRTDPVEEIREAQTELGIDAESCVPYMTDTYMDYGMAVDGLLSKS